MGEIYMETVITTERADPVPARVRTPEPKGAGHRTLRAVALVCLLFVLSGACGLAYQVVWAKYLGLFLGNTVLLHTAVLGSFMGGLALGSLAIGARASRSVSPLKVYGWLELLIAGYALLFPQAAAWGHEAIIRLAETLPPGSTSLLVVRVVMAMLLLIVPTLLMGATYPYLTAHLERTVESGTRGANWLYAANCGGAVLGALVTGLGLIPELGISATLMAIAILNAAVALTAILASGRDPAPLAAPVTPGPKATASERTDRILLVAICLSGATAFIYELVWTRLFAVTLGSSTYSFTLMLAAFITGLALGSIMSDLVPAVRRNAWVVFAAAELVIGLAIALALPLYPRLPYWLWKVKWLLRASEDTVGLYFLLQYGLIFAVMAVPTFLFGLTFPAAIRAAALGPAGRESEGGKRSVADHAAAVYGWNTIGTLVGVALAGCVLIPWLGLRGSLMVGACLNLAIGLLIAVRSGALRRAPVPCWSVAGVAVLVLVVAPAWHPLSLTYGAFRTQGRPPATWRGFIERIESRQQVFYREDFGTTVAVLRNKSGEGQVEQLSLVVDGKTDASSVGDLATQSLLAHVPMFIRPQAKDVFVVGLGSGVTVGSVLAHPVERVDCVEISRAVVEAAGQFREVNRDALKDPRVNLVVDDGRTVLGATRKQYDLIISEPTNPWISGVGNLFSAEFFRLAASRLKSDGIVAQWFHGYELDDRLVATILRTFRGVFPHAVIFQGNQTDYIMIGSREPLAPDFLRMQERYAQAAVARDLSRIGIRGVPGLLALQLQTEAGVEELAREGGINSDDLPLLEYLAPRTLYVSAFAQRIVDTDARMREGSGTWLSRYLSRPGAGAGDYAALMTALADARIGNPGLYEKTLRYYLTRWPRDADRNLELAVILANRRDFEGALTYARAAATVGGKGARELVGRIEKDLEASSRTGLIPGPAAGTRGPTALHKPQISFN